METPYDITIKLNEIRQFFNSLDPSPFRERDLDPEAADYIIGTAKDFSFKKPMRLVLLLPGKQIKKLQQGQIKDAISHYFTYEIEALQKKFRRLLKDGRKSFLIGTAFLASCLALSELSHIYLSGFSSTLFSEGLMIIGWVSMWKPISIFLYDWWPISKEKRIYEKIRDMEVQLASY